MTEVLDQGERHVPSIAERVFGVAEASSDGGARAEYERTRFADIEAGKTVWFTERFEPGDAVITANLFKDRKIVAVVRSNQNIDPEHAAGVYITAPLGRFADTPLQEDVPFNSAVLIAEQFARSISEVESAINN